jgi:hypothetical protein
MVDPQHQKKKSEKNIEKDTEPLMGKRPIRIRHGVALLQNDQNLLPGNGTHPAGTLVEGPTGAPHRADEAGRQGEEGR